MCRLNGDLAHARGVDALDAIVDARGDRGRGELATAVNSSVEAGQASAPRSREERSARSLAASRGERRGLASQFGQSVWEHKTGPSARRGA